MGRSPILSQLWDYPAPSKTFGCSKDLTVMDNVLIAMNKAKQKEGFLRGVLRLPKFLSQRGCNERESHGIIAYLLT